MHSCNVRLLHAAILQQCRGSHVRTHARIGVQGTWKFCHQQRLQHNCVALSGSEVQ